MDLQELSREAPYVRGLPWVGALPALLRRGAVPVFEECWRRHGDAFRLRLGGSEVLVLAHPDAIRAVLVTARSNYVKGDSYAPIRRLTGDNLLTLDGEAWQGRRRVAQPAFHRQVVQSLVASMVDVTRDGLESLRVRVPDGGEFDAGDEMARLTMDVVGATLLGHRLGPAGYASAQALARAFRLVGERAQLPLILPGVLRRTHDRRLRAALETVDAIVYAAIVRELAASPEGSAPTLLSMLLAVRDAETGEALSYPELRDEIIMLLLTGSETTALALTWGFTLLGRHPRVVERIYAELEDVLGGREPTAADLPRLVYLRQVLDEILRVRSPAWALPRTAVCSDVVGGVRVRANELVMAMPYLAHRHPDFWTAPDRFDPDRFDPARTNGRAPAAYFPFGAGPRRCIGHLFALSEAQVILATLFQRAELSLVATKLDRPRGLITLRPSSPVRVRCRWRGSTLPARART